MLLAASEILCLCWIFFLSAAVLYEGDNCIIRSPDGPIPGRCLSAYKCPWALDRIRDHQHTDLCSFNRRTPIVCCPNEIFKQPNPSFDETEERDSLASFSSRGTEFGKLSQAKCEEFYPKPKFHLFVGATGGKKSLPEEFPHMAILGFGESNDKQWKCGGSLITLQHILTAAHCVYSRDFGYVKYVRLGDLNIQSTTDQAEPQDFTVKRATRHPNFDSGTVTHDIAILELDSAATLTNYVKPACLHLGEAILANQEITATGWGVTEFAGQQSDHLVKVTLKVVDKDDCRKQFANTGRKGNIDDARQLCAGSADNDKIMDTCQGDSGGPLQVKNNTNIQHYNIIGVTSFGKACGITNSAGIYTRVSYYIPWIEEVIFKT